MRPVSSQSLPSRRAVVVMRVRVRAGVGLGDRERHDHRAVGDAGQPALLLLLGAEARDDRAADRRRDHHHEQAAAGRGQLLTDDRELVHAAAAAAVLLGQVDADEAELACLAPQLGRCSAGGAPGGCIRGRSACRASATALRRARCSSVSVKSIGSPPRLSFGHDGEHGADVDLLADGDRQFGEHAVGGALIWCCIFIASSHRIGWPAVTTSPTATAIRTTVPGIGASSEPAATFSAGSTKRSATRTAQRPATESTWQRRRRSGATANVRAHAVDVEDDLARARRRPA